MLKRLSLAAASAFIMLVAASFLYAPSLLAQNKGDLCAGANLSFSQSGPDRSCNNPPGPDGAPGKELDSVVQSIVNVISIIIGIIAVIMIIIGGFKYITSGGDSGKVTGAKNTIIYAIVGLIVIALAQFIVRFVLSRASSATDAGETTTLLLASLLSR